MSGWQPPDILTSVGPVNVYGYDGRIHLDRGSPHEWRAFRMMQAKARGTHTAEEWKKKKLAIGKCLLCGRDDIPLTQDHIIPVSGGGCDCIENLQPLCKPCNSKKSARIE